MGFYGNITNTSKTQFQFDRIYANRYEMERKKTTDGIYIGRYVLIEYDTNLDSSVFKPQFYKINNSFYTAAIADNGVALRVPNDVEINDIIQIVPEHNSDYNEGIEFYMCVGSEQGTNLAQFKSIIAGKDANDNYLVNFAIDKERYGAGRGYDSTAWQKIYQENEEKYVMIAELNSVVPTFDISSDAPTLEPIPPHFDANSTNVYYKMHAQPQWGFRIKEENPTPETSTDLTPRPSDVHVDHKSYVYDKETGKISPEFYSYHGGIYFNRDGFSPVLKTHRDGLNDDIQLNPTGISGAKYNAHNGTAGQMSTLPDTMEFSMMLPSLGNAISDIWDLVYNDPGNDNLRNRDISWNSTYGVRLVHEDPNGSGFTYSPDEVETLAGCINSVHDLMGMIIDDDTLKEEVDNASTDKIYYIGGKYYVKYPYYEYSPITEEITDYEQIARYKEVVVIPYEKDKYYYKDGQNYLLGSQDNFIAGTNYYTISSKQEEVAELSYEPNVFYTKDANSNYFLETSADIDFKKTYYKFTPVKSNPIYFPNLYYVQVTKNGSTYYEMATTAQMQTGVQYYKVVYQESEEDYIEDENGNFVPVVVATFEKITLQQFSPTGMWIKDGDNYKLMNTPEKEIQYYTITNEEKYDRLYQGGKYYYLENHNYMLDYSPSFIQERIYYTLTSTLIKEPFYAPKTFYYLVDGLYTSDTSESFTPGRVYYEKGGLYVYEDKLGLFAQGAEWNESVLDIPEEITLATRELYYDFKELEGFARSLNTIHGLIIQINNLLQAYDLSTRDNTTVQGCINILNDTIAQFGKHAPEQFMIVDDYGRYISSGWTTAQEYTVENINKGLDETQTTPPTEGRFVDVVIDGTPGQPLITVVHKKNSHAFTTSIANKNNETGDGVNKGANDTLVLHTPWKDNMGHIAGYNAELITLPYGYTKITAENSGNITPSDSNLTSEAIASKSTLDTLKMVGANKWIQAQTVQEGNNTSVFNIFHAAYDNIPVEQTETNYNNTADNSFIINDIQTIDTAGHITNVSNKTIYLPYNYKTAKILNTGKTEKTIAYSFADGDLIADTHIATMTIDSGNRWINLAADETNRKVTLYHAAAGDIVSTGALGQNTNATLKFGESFKVLQAGLDEAGHVAALSAHTITLPTLSISTNAPTGQILTGLTVSQDGVVTPVTSTLSNMTLNNFTYNATDASNIGSNDTLGAALSKLQLKLIGDSTVVGSVDNKIDVAVNKLINGAPGTLDTFKEVATWIEEDEAGTVALINRVSEAESNIDTLENKLSSDTTVEGSVGQIIESMNSDIYERLEDVELGLYGVSETEGVMKWYQGSEAPAVGTDGKVVNGYSMWVNTNTGKIHFYNMVTGTWEAINTWQ